LQFEADCFKFIQAKSILMRDIEPQPKKNFPVHRINPNFRMFRLEGRV